MNTVYIVTGKPYGTPGTGDILGVFATEDLAHGFIKLLAPNALYDETAEWYDDGANLYGVEPHTVRTETPSEAWMDNKRARVGRANRIAQGERRHA